MNADTVVTSSHAVVSDGDEVRRRSVPELYLIDEEQRILVATSASSSLDKSKRRLVWDVVANLLAQRPSDDDDVIGVVDSYVIRIISTVGSERPTYCVLVERRREVADVARAAGRFDLTKRETDVLKLLMLGMSTNAIADALAIADTTTADHIKHIAAKTNSRSRSQIVARVLGY